MRRRKASGDKEGVRVRPGLAGPPNTVPVPALLPPSWGARVRLQRPLRRWGRGGPPVPGRKRTPRGPGCQDRMEHRAPAARFSGPRADSFLSRLRPLTQAPGFRRGRARHGPRPRPHVPLLPDVGPRHWLGPTPVIPGGAGSTAEAQKHGREPPPAAACPPQTQSCYDRHATHRCNVQAPGLNPDGR